MTSEVSKTKLSKKQDLLDQLKLLENEEEEPVVKIEDVKLDKPRPLPESAGDSREEEKPDLKVYQPKKPKRIVKARTEKQIESLAQGRLKRDLNNIEKQKLKEHDDLILNKNMKRS